MEYWIFHYSISPLLHHRLVAGRQCGCRPTATPSPPNPPAASAPLRESPADPPPPRSCAVLSSSVGSVPVFPVRRSRHQSESGRIPPALPSRLHHETRLSGF